VSVPESEGIPGKRQNDAKMAPLELVASRCRITSLSRLNVRRHAAFPIPFDSNNLSRMSSLSMRGSSRAGANRRPRVVFPLPGSPEITTKGLRIRESPARHYSGSTRSLFTYHLAPIALTTSFPAGGAGRGIRSPRRRLSRGECSWRRGRAEKPGDRTRTASTDRDKLEIGFQRVTRRSQIGSLVRPLEITQPREESFVGRIGTDGRRSRTRTR